MIEHLEKYLGRIAHGWSVGADGQPMPFQVAECREGQLRGVSSYVTIGLGSYPLLSKQSQARVRHELLIMAPTALGSRNIPSVLQYLGLNAIESDQCWLRGEVIGPRRGAVVNSTELSALYVAPPVYLPAEFSTYRSADGEAVVIAWLVPITAKEAAFIASHGWSHFETMLEELDPNLVDLDRPCMVDEYKLR